MVHGKNEEYTAKPACRAALVSFILRTSLESPRAALIEPSLNTIEARTALATAPFFLTLGLGLVPFGLDFGLVGVSKPRLVLFELDPARA